MGLRSRASSSIKVRAGKHATRSTATAGTTAKEFSWDDVDGIGVVGYLNREQLKTLHSIGTTPEALNKAYGPVVGILDENGTPNEIRFLEVDGNRFSVLYNSVDDGTREFLMNAADPLAAREAMVTMFEHVRDTMADEIAANTAKSIPADDGKEFAESFKGLIDIFENLTKEVLEDNAAAAAEEEDFTPVDGKKFRKLFKKFLTADEDDGEGGKAFGLRFVDEKLLQEAADAGLLASSPIMMEEIGAMRQFMEDNPGVWEANLIAHETDSGVGVYVDELVSKKPLTEDQYASFEEFLDDSHIENVVELDDGCTFASWTPSEDKLDYETDVMGALGGFMATLGQELTDVQKRGTDLRTDTEFASKLEAEAGKIGNQLIDAMEKETKRDKKTGNVKTKLPETPEGQAAYLEKLKKRDEVANEANKATAAALLGLLRTAVPPTVDEKDTKKSKKESKTAEPKPTKIPVVITDENRNEIKDMVEKMVTKKAIDMQVSLSKHGDYRKLLGAASTLGKKYGLSGKEYLQIQLQGMVEQGAAANWDSIDIDTKMSGLLQGMDTVKKTVASNFEVSTKSNAKPTAGVPKHSGAARTSSSVVIAPRPAPASSLETMERATRERSRKISENLLMHRTVNLDTDAEKLQRRMRAVKLGTVALPAAGDYSLLSENGRRRNLEFELESHDDNPNAVAVYIQSPDGKSKHRVGRLDIKQYLAGTDQRPRWDMRRAEVEIPDRDRGVFFQELSRFIAGFSE
jgi:hypothetical protein